MAINSEKAFNHNISKVINEKIKDINTFKNVLPLILNKDNIIKSKISYQLTDEILLFEIYSRFGENCLSERTFKSIKRGYFCSSALNICYVTQTLNNLIDKINQEIKKSNAPYNLIEKIDLNKIFFIIN